MGVYEKNKAEKLERETRQPVRIITSKEAALFRKNIKRDLKKIKNLMKKMDNMCKVCNGTGGTPRNPCKSCDGSGQVRPKPIKS